MVDMSRQTEERNRQKFADKMRQKTLASKNAKQAAKKGSETGTPSTEAGKKD
jgi:hypothetical protein